MKNREGLIKDILKAEPKISLRYLNEKSDEDIQALHEIYCFCGFCGTEIDVVRGCVECEIDQ